MKMTTGPQRPPGDPPTVPPRSSLISLGYYPIEPEPKKPKPPKPPKPPKKFVSSFRPPEGPKPDPKPNPRPSNPTKMVARAAS